VAVLTLVAQGTDNQRQEETITAGINGQ
jgi:hypothetical protein